MLDFKQKLEFDSALHLKLYSGVKNIPDLRAQVMSGQLPCALIKPELILDPFQIVVAANKAVVKENLSTIITKSIHTELLFNLSVSKNITQCLVKFGVDDKDTDLLYAYISKQGEELQDVSELIVGDIRPIEDLFKLSEPIEIQKSYGIQDEECKVSDLLDSVVTRIAAKECL